jgi:hypothetical protein
MPSLVPLNNAIAQNSLDFNNQNPTNKGGLFRYNINNYTRVNYGSVGQHSFTNADLNSVCIFSGDVDILLSAGYLNPAPLTGTEILFYSAAGRIKLVPSGFSLYSNVGNFTVPTKAGKIIYTSGNIWYFSSLNTDVFTPDVTDCCSISTGNIYQLGNNNSGSLDANVKIYADANATVPFNGIVQDNLSTTRYNVINGQASVITDCDTAVSYNVEYTFYTEDPIYPGEVTPIVFYSKPYAGTPNNYGTLVGNRFFTTIPNGGNAINSCYSYATVAPGSPVSYYGDSTQYPANPVTFLNGYVINYEGIPYKGSPI